MLTFEDCLVAFEWLFLIVGTGLVLINVYIYSCE